MSERYPGGIISKTPVTPSGPAGTNTAPGIWTLEQQAYYQSQGSWPSPYGTQDPYFKNVTYLLNNNNTNGAQNNTFLDSSTNAYSITRNGNTSQGTFSPYGSLWSNYFNGSSYLYTASSAVFGTGTGNFTVEAWVLPTSLRAASGENNIMGNASTNGWLLGYFANSIYLASTNNGYTVQISYTLTIGAWSHIAAVRNGNTVTIYVNGTSIGSGTYTTNCPTGYCAIGGDGANGTARCMYGYISSARFNNTALYSSNFTPSTTPLTAVSGTQILSAQSNRFIDNSTNAFTLTATGSPSVQRFSPFHPTAPYSTTTIGGSGYFDGSGDYLQSSGRGGFANNSTFTVEFWAYPLSSISSVCFINSSDNTNFYIETSGGTLFVGDGSINTISTSAPPLNQWTHVALSFDGTTYRLYYNGVQQASSTNVMNGNSFTGFRVGLRYDASRPYNGYMTDVRVLVGTNLYPSGTTFTPPTAPLTAITNTALLLNTTNASLYDSAMANDIETGDTAQVSTDVQKFSLATLKTTGDTSGAQVQPSSLRSPSSTNWAFGTGDFTVEWWCYGTSGMAPDSAIICSELPSRNWLIQWNTGSFFTMQTAWGDDVLSSAGTAPFNTWLHCALVRTSGTLKFFINGTQTYSSGFAYDMNVVSGLQVGSHKSTSSDVLYMSQVRITKGYARYTSSFTPSTTTFPTW